MFQRESQLARLRTMPILTFFFLVKQCTFLLKTMKWRQEKGEVVHINQRTPRQNRDFDCTLVRKHTSQSSHSPTNLSDSFSLPPRLSLSDFPFIAHPSVIPLLVNFSLTCLSINYQVQKSLHLYPISKITNHSTRLSQSKFN